MRLPKEIRIIIVEQMSKHASPTKTIRYLKTNKNVVTSTKAVRETLKKWRETGSVMDNLKGHSGRTKTVRLQQTIDQVKNEIKIQPSNSVRKLAFQNNLSRSTVHRILRKDLKLSSFKSKVSQELLENDRERRFVFCERFKQMSENGQLDVNNIIFSDECHIYLHGMVNKQNNRQWSLSNPCHTFEKPLHSAKVTIWCGLSSHKIYGPYFFENPENGQAITVTSASYLEMLKKIFPDDVSTDPDEFFQQDGATAHTCTASLAWLEHRFSGKIISNRSSFPWPARSPDLSPLDFFLWGYVKSKVFQGKPGSLQEVKSLATDAIRSVNENMRIATIANFCKRVDACMQEKGGHFENVMNTK